MDYSDSALAEVYDIEKTVEIHLMRGPIYRLEVVRRMKGTADVQYDVRYYEQQTFYRAPDGTIGTESVSKATDFHVWFPDRNFPWMHERTPEGALSQAVSWLAERRNK